MPVLVGEYSVAFHVYIRPFDLSNSTDDGFRMLFLFDCSWGLLTNGTHVKFVWEDSIVTPVDMYVIFRLPSSVDIFNEWTHWSVRLWEDNTQIYVDGKFVGKALSCSPNVENCGFYLGSVGTIGVPKNQRIKAVFYLYSYFNHIISDAELNEHLESTPPRITRRVNVENLIASDKLEEKAVPLWESQAVLIGVFLVLISMVAFWWRRRKKEAKVKARKVCSECYQSLTLKMFSGEEWNKGANRRCLSCTKEERREEIERLQAEEKEKALRKEKKKEFEKKKKEERRRMEEEKEKERRNLEERVRTSEKEILKLKDRLKITSEDLEVQRAIVKECKKSEKVLLDKLNEKNANERDAMNWLNHVNEMKRKDNAAKEMLETQLKALQTLMKKGGVKKFLAYVYSSYPPKNHNKFNHEESDEKNIRLAILNYHPDKQDEVLHGKLWCKICQEICAILNTRKT